MACVMLIASPSLSQFQIDRLNPSWTSSLSLGVIGHSPDRLNFPSTACCLKRSVWLLQRDSVFHNSLKVIFSFILLSLILTSLFCLCAFTSFLSYLCFSFYFLIFVCLMSSFFTLLESFLTSFSLLFPQICENYGPNLDTCPEGTVLGLLVDGSGCLHLFVNGMDQGVAAQDIPSPCYPLIDLYGQCEQVRT